VSKLTPHLSMFAIVGAWNFVYVAAVRTSVDQSLLAVPTTLAIVGFWFAGTRLCRDWWLLPAALVGGAIGTFLGIKV